MGVKNLWPILDDIQKHIPLNDLSGQILSIDLSIWIVEANQIISKSLKKPYLRHIFFRVWNLLKLNILPVIVIEGKAPDLKQEIIKSRLGYTNVYNKPISRTRLNSIQKECCEMLDYLGIPHVKASGEAEAMCAFLNYNNLVDACITNDGDAFLYGAIKVYRNFTTNKEPSVAAYSLNEMESKYKLSRKNLIGFGILCGCDYLVKGVPGCGPKLIVELIKEIEEESLLECFQKWHKSNYELQILAAGKNENNVCLKAKKCPGFPFDDIVNEFLINRNILPQKKFEWSRPDINKFIKFSIENFEWSIEYSIEKIIVCLSFFELTQNTSQENRILFPNKILKSVIRSGVKSYEVEWKKIENENFMIKPYYITCEDQILIKNNFPDIVQTFEEAVILKKNKKGKSTKTSKEVKQLTELFCSIDIKSNKSSKNMVKLKENIDNNIPNNESGFNMKFIKNKDEITSDIIVNYSNTSFFSEINDKRTTSKFENHFKSKRRSRSLNCLNHAFNNETYNCNMILNKFEFSEIQHTPSLKKGFKLDEHLLNNIKTPNNSSAKNLERHNKPESINLEVGNFNLNTSILCFTPSNGNDKTNIYIRTNSLLNLNAFDSNLDFGEQGEETIDSNIVFKSNFNDHCQIPKCNLKYESKTSRLEFDSIHNDYESIKKEYLIKNTRSDNYYDLPLIERLRLKNKHLS